MSRRGRTSWQSRVEVGSGMRERRDEMRERKVREGERASEELVGQGVGKQDGGKMLML